VHVEGGRESIALQVHLTVQRLPLPSVWTDVDRCGQMLAARGQKAGPVLPLTAAVSERSA